MTTRLPAGRRIPVSLGNVTRPAPGAQELSQGVFEIWARPVLGRGASPKHVQPLPPLALLSRSAAAASDGGTRKKMAWWSSALPGKNSLEMT